MGKSIQIKLLPAKKDRIYQPLPDFSDLYVLMNKLHLNTVNSAVEEEEESTVSELELQVHNVHEQINEVSKEESTLNVMTECLESADKSIKKFKLSNKMQDKELSQIEDFNKILEESDLSIKKHLHKLDKQKFITDIDSLLSQIGENLRLINSRKNSVKSNITNLSANLIKIETLKENINSSNTDIDSVEVAIKNLDLH
jgi:hypothetical protein